MRAIICTTFYALFTAVLLLPQAGSAKPLLTATIPEAGAFVLDGDDRAHVVGGLIKLGNQSWKIIKTSVHNLIGASGETGADGSVQHVVFSSSFSKQTATGQPWVAAGQYLGCNQPYNSFLAVYTVSDQAKLAQLDTLPFARLTDSLEASDKSVVYCFFSTPMERKN